MSLSTWTETKPDLFEEQINIETPAIVVDLDVMERNMKDYAEFADQHDVALRSHTKTHRIPDLAHRQEEYTDGDGVVCQTLSEAEVLAQNGIDDIYLSYMVVEESKLDRLVALSEKLKRFVTTVDCPGNIRPVQQAAARHDTKVEVVLEIDIGLNRVGVKPGAPALEMAQVVQNQPNLDLAGIMAYEGHIGYGSGKATTEEEFEQRCAETMDEVEATVDLLEANGVFVNEVKVGSTATSKYSGTHSVVTEINPGMYPFNDGHLLDVPHIDQDDCALTVLSTVISKPTDDRVIVDAGTKSIAPQPGFAPVSKGIDDLDYYNASEEHGWIDVGLHGGSIEVGDRLAFIPPHVCPTINLHDTLIGVRDGIVEETWHVQGRGKVK